MLLTLLLGKNKISEDYELFDKEIMKYIDPLGENEPDQADMQNTYFAKIAAAYFIYKTDEGVVDMSDVCSFGASCDPTVFSFLQNRLFSFVGFEKMKANAKEFLDGITNKEKPFSKNVTSDYILGSDSEYRGQNDTENISTPEYIISLARSILDIKVGERVADLCCGRGKSLVKFFEREPDAVYFGVESNEDFAAIATMRLEVLGGEHRIVNKSAFDEDLFGDGELKFDKVFSDIPLISKDEAGLDAVSARADWDFYKKAAELLGENGKAVVLATSSTLGDVKTYKDLRKVLIDEKSVEAVIELNDNISYGNSYPFKKSFPFKKKYLLVLGKNNSKVRFIDATRCFSTDKKVTVLSDDDVEKICRQYLSEGAENGVVTVSTDEIARNDYSLLPSKYNADYYIRYMRNARVHPRTPKSTAKKGGSGRFLRTEYEACYSDGIVAVRVKPEKIDLSGREKKRLEDIAVIKRGTPVEKAEIDKRKSDEKTTFKYLSIADIEDGVIDYDSLVDLKEFPEKQEKYYVEHGKACIVISKNGSPVRMALIKSDENDVLVSSNFYIIKINDDEFDPRYVMAYLRAHASVIEHLSRGDNIPSLYKEDLANFELYCLTKEEQEKIADEYEECENKIRELKKSLVKKLKTREEVFFKAVKNV